MAADAQTWLPTAKPSANRCRCSDLAAICKTNRQMAADAQTWLPSAKPLVTRRRCSDLAAARKTNRQSPPMLRPGCHPQNHSPHAADAQTYRLPSPHRVDSEAFAQLTEYVALFFEEEADPAADKGLMR
jgi:hypothetical protein